MQVINVRAFGGVAACKKKFDKFIYIGRGSPLGNEWTHLPNTKAKYIVKDRAEAIAKYKEWIFNQLANGVPEIVKEFTCIQQESVLGCYCRPLACHGDAIIEAWEWWKAEFPNLVEPYHLPCCTYTQDEIDKLLQECGRVGIPQEEI